MWECRDRSPHLTSLFHVSFFSVWSSLIKTHRYTLKVQLEEENDQEKENKDKRQEEWREEEEKEKEETNREEGVSAEEVDEDKNANEKKKYEEKKEKEDNNTKDLAGEENEEDNTNEKKKRGEEERKEEEKRSWQRGIKTRKQIEEQIKEGNKRERTLKSEQTRKPRRSWCLDPREWLGIRGRGAAFPGDERGIGKGWSSRSGGVEEKNIRSGKKRRWLRQGIEGGPGKVKA